MMVDIENSKTHKKVIRIIKFIKFASFKIKVNILITNTVAFRLKRLMRIKVLLNDKKFISPKITSLNQKA